MAWIDNLWYQHEQNEKHEIMVTDLPEYFKHDFEIWSAFNKYFKNGSLSLENIEWCRIYHIRIPCNYDYEKEDEEIEKMESELSEKLKQEWMKRYTEEFDEEFETHHHWDESFSEQRLEMLKAVRAQREYDWREEDWEFELQDQIDNEKKERWKKIKTELKWIAFQDIEKFKEYTSLYNLLKLEISTKRDFCDIDIIIIEDNKKERTWIHIPVPWKLAEKTVKSGIKSYIKRLLRQPFWIDDKSYKKLVDDYANEIYDIFRINNSNEQKAKLEDLKTKKPDVVAIRNTIKKESSNLSYYSRPSSWPYKYDEELEKMRGNNTVYEVNF